MHQPRINWLWKCRLQLVDLFRDCAQSCDVFCLVAAALFIPNHCEAFSQSLRQTGQSVFHSWLLPVRSAVTSLGQQLSLRLEPIRLRVTRQCESAASLGNEIRAQTNLFIRGLCWYSRLWRDGTLCSLRSCNLFIAHPRLFSVCGCAARPGRFTGVHFCGRSGSFWRRLIFALDNFGLFRHRLIGVNDFNSFNALRGVGKCFLALL